MGSMPGPAFDPKACDHNSYSPTVNVMMAVAQTAAGMEFLKERVQAFETRVNSVFEALDSVGGKLEDNKLVQQRILDNLKFLVGNGPQAMEPVIPAIQRQIGELRKFQAELETPIRETIQDVRKEGGLKDKVEALDRFQYRVGLIYIGGASLVTLLLKSISSSAWDWFKRIAS